MAGLDLPFWIALGRSILTGVAVACVALGVGWPLGTIIGLSRFPLRRTLLAFLATPLLLPSFLAAIGLSMLWRGADGFLAVVWAFSTLGIPLVCFSTMAATLTLTRGQTDSARLAGGQGLVFRLALRATFPMAGLAAALAGLLSLSDPGPGQIFRWQGVAGELLTSFAAQYDRAAAINQALALTGVASLVAGPLAWKLAPQVAEGLFARDVIRPAPTGLAWGPRGFLWLVCMTLLTPIFGIFRPLLSQSWQVERAWSEVERTWLDTLLYAGLAGIIVLILSFGMAFISGRSSVRRRWMIAGALALLAFPPTLPALWLIPWSGRLTLGAALALRGLPVGMLLALRAESSMPISWRYAARVHRISAATFFTRIVIPWCSRWGLPCMAISALLATAEVGTVLLLHPPGHANLPLALFTIMANAPEVLVSTLSFLYILLALAMAIAGQQIAKNL